MVLLFAFAAIIWFDNAFNRGITYTPDPTPIQWANGPLVGVNVYNLHLEPDPNAVTRTLELVRDMGARYVRMQVPWEDIEIHGRGDFEDRRNIDTVGVISAWDKYDHIVAVANKLDLELIMRLDRPPDWAREGFRTSPYFQEGLQIDPNSTGPPDDNADFGNFVYTIVERYEGKVRFFQIWNEPNLMNEWNWQTPRPEDFVDLLRVAYTAARAANPNAVILFPSLAPTDGLDKRAPMSELDYLDRVYRAGGGAYFDIMSAQAYGLGQPPDEHRYVRLRNLDNWVWTHPIDTRTDVSRVVLIREIMERHGDGDKAIWIGEFGWNSAPERIPPARRFTWGQPVSEEQKAAYIIGQIERARREWPWIGVMHVWMLRYGGYQEPDPADPTPYFALVQRDWTPLPAYTRLQEYLAQPAVAGVGAHTWDHAAVETMPDGWRLRFTGARVTLIGGLTGDIEASLNGEPALLLRDSIDGKQALSTPPGLQDGTHTLEISAPGATPPERFVVARDPPAPWFWIIAPALVVGLLLVSGAATMHALFAVADQLVARTALWRLGPRAWRVSRAGERTLLLWMFVGVVIFYRASTEVPLTAVGLVIFGACALLRPDLALLYVPLTVPLFFMPKGVWDERFGIRPEGVQFPLHEVLLLIVTGAAFVHWLGAFWTTRRRADAQTRRSEINARAVLVIASQYFRANLPILLFLVAGTIGVLIAPAEGRGAALREWRWLIVEPLLFYGLLRYFFRRQTTDNNDQQPAVSGQSSMLVADYRLWMTGSFVLGGALVGMIGILQFLGLNLAPLIGSKAGFSDDSIFVEGVRRVNSVYGHPNNLGLYTGRVWPIAAALALACILVQSLSLSPSPRLKVNSSKERNGAQDARKPGHKDPASRSPGLAVSWFPGFAGPWLPLLFFGISALLALGGLMVSFSKGALLGAAGAAVVLIVTLGPWQARSSWRLLGFLAGLAAVGGGSVLAAAVFDIERLNLLGETSGIRLKTWASALAMVRDHPLLGIGLDQFVRLYPQYIHPSLANTNEINTSHPHNLVLDIWLRLGVPGLVAFGWLLWRFATRLRGWGFERDDKKNQGESGSAHPQPRAISRAQHAASTREYLRAGLAAAMIAALLHGLVDNFYFVPDLAFAFWLLLALGEEAG